MSTNRLRKPGAVTAVCGILFLTAACDWFSEGTPETVRVVLTGDEDADVNLIVSQDFATGIREDGATVVTVLASDTLTMTLPFDSVFRLLGPEDGATGRRFFFQVERLADSLAVFQAQAFVDDRRAFDESGSLEDDPYRFAYSFNQPIFQIEEVLF